MTLSTIWKKQLELTDQQEVSLPQGAEILHVREQFGALFMWFKCNPNAPPMPHTILICGTGHPAPNGEAKYLGTGHLANGSLILHVFEKLDA